MEKIYGVLKLLGLQLFLSGTLTFSSGTLTFCQMGVLNSCFQNPSESSGSISHQAFKSYGPLFMKIHHFKRRPNIFYQNFMKLGHIVKYHNVFFKFDNGPYRTMLSVVMAFCL